MNAATQGAGTMADYRDIVQAWIEQEEDRSETIKAARALLRSRGIPAARARRIAAATIAEIDTATDRSRRSFGV